MYLLQDLVHLDFDFLLLFDFLLPLLDLAFLAPTRDCTDSLDGDIVVVPPNAIARVGFALQTLLFPFQQVFSAGSGALLISNAL